MDDGMDMYCSSTCYASYHGPSAAGLVTVAS